MPANMQRAPRTPESYFNVPESITLLNIVKSDRIQSAFQSNRKNHASVWEMVANILSRYSDKRRSAKQCCNRYENLKKIYTQLKRNPEKHVRRNWPYLYLFREIEEQRGEQWGVNSKRAKESYYYRRRAMMLLKNEGGVDDGQEEDPSLPEGLLPTNLGSQIQIQAIQGRMLKNKSGNAGSLVDGSAADLSEAVTRFLKQAAAAQPHGLNNNNNNNNNNNSGKSNKHKNSLDTNSVQLDDDDGDVGGTNNGGFDYQHGIINIKEEFPDQEYDEDDDNSLINNNYNGNHQNLYQNGQHDNDIEPNILHPDVIMDTDHVTDTSSISLGLNRRNSCSKRKLSTSSDTESTNYELIEYLKRREKRDEEMFKRMDEREEKLMKLLDRTVVAIERIASQSNTTINSSNSSSSTSTTNAK